MPYQFGKTIGKGGYGVVLQAYDAETGKNYATKFIKKDKMEVELESHVENEINVMKKLSHPNIVSLIDTSLDDEYVDEDGKTHEAYSITMELAEWDLFDFIVKTGTFSDELCRHYFHQIIDSIEYIHSRGIMHRDIKPENLLIDNSYTLKLTDFGFATTETIVNTKKGTDYYFGPEMFIAQQFETVPLDIFAAGIILFMIFSGRPAFATAKANDAYYKLFWVNNKAFWKLQQKKWKDKSYSPEFIELINWILDLNPKSRPTISDIKSSAWYNGELLTTEQVEEEMQKRFEKLKQT